MLTLWNQFDELFNDDASRIRRPLARSFAPAVDIEEVKDGYLLTADLPGMTADEVDITIENGVLVVSGERKQEKVENKDGYRRVERSFGSFRRSFTLPKGVDVEGVSAKTENGQLQISVPKPVAEIARKVKIQ